MNKDYRYLQLVRNFHFFETLMKKETTNDKRMMTTFIAAARVRDWKMDGIVTKTHVKYLILNMLLSRALSICEKTKKI